MPWANIPVTADEAVFTPPAERPPANRLQYEVDHSSNPAFNWRTERQKSRLTPGFWYVFLKYADGKPVICDVVNGAGVPCVYHLEVGRE